MCTLNASRGPGSTHCSSFVDSASARSGTTPLLPHPDPFVTPHQIKNQRWGRSISVKSFSGWHFGVCGCALVAGSVCGINMILTIWASLKFGVTGGIGTIQDGQCSKTKNLSLWLHLAINALSTLLLSASNYCMQCLSSPTRGEVDKAHSRHVWLDIGVPSVRNLRRISWSRIILWWLLALSSIPLHLMYNSAVFSTLAAQEYDIFVVTEDFLTGASFNMNETAYSAHPWWPNIIYNPDPDFLSNEDWSQAESDLQRARLDDLKENQSSLKRLENEACMKAYGQEFVSAYSDVIVVSSAINDSNSLLATTLSPIIPNQQGFGTTTYAWICISNPESQRPFPVGSDCDVGKAATQADSWAVFTFPVKYCLSRPILERCKLQFSLWIMIIIIICNTVKTTCMVVMWRQDHKPLVTLGDAIASFLRVPDQTTAKNCLADKGRILGGSWTNVKAKWKAESRFWFRSASLKRWLICNILCCATLMTAGILLGSGLNNGILPDRSISYQWKLGYGTITSVQLTNLQLPRSGALLITVLIANAPQVLLSFLYLTYNGLYTCMLLADEWSGFARERKALRVTKAEGEFQRSTYRLQLPYKYGIPLVILSGLLHWLVSQSLFLARVTIYDQDGVEDDEISISTCGYSNIALMTTILLGSIVVMLGVVNGFRRYPAGMPLVGSCSAAISAACHPPKADSDAAVLPLMWGAVPTTKETGHCCFTSFEVTPPVREESYADVTNISQGSDDTAIVTTVIPRIGNNLRLR